ncbi:class I SAM-dependent methyltransferase [Helcobacillus sp. ACRRO]|uniref:class I SAM-dependent DNA methyltransferase n=1 Tax=Helcobacillus sp. ACRRO TaxID=2918202 RepID=UPI001EF601ED|nr:class I SAM-dependent methyltransferase [Helcobacillus sp. ACRRO]MCG7426794.1 class I SAM-dependent methyltransferase [Helcobacillus sp. ACRRO]
MTSIPVFPRTGAQPPGPAENIWLRAVHTNPNHAADYFQRWRRLAAQGQDIHGEARMIDAMLERGSFVIDAGCGTGRTGGYLFDAGHRVIGVDLDETLIAAARTDHPGADWRVGNLAELDLRAADGSRLMADVIVSAGNVMSFLAAAERRPALVAIRAHLSSTSRFVAGFQTHRGWSAEDFIADAERAGMRLQQAFSSWQLAPFTGEDGFLVAVLVRA